MGEFSLFCDCEAPSRTVLLFGDLRFYDIYKKLTANEFKMNKTLLCGILLLKVKLLLVFIISQQLYHTFPARRFMLFSFFPTGLTVVFQIIYNLCNFFSASNKVDSTRALATVSTLKQSIIVIVSCADILELSYFSLKLGF